MAVICFGGVAGSPGTTTSALSVAATWPERCLFVEANPDGGELLVRYRLIREVGLISLASALRHGTGNVDVEVHSQWLGELRAVIAPDSPIQASMALSTAGPNLGRWLQQLNTDVIVDVGRVRYGSPAESLLAQADMTLVCSRPVAEQIQPSAAMLKWFSEHHIAAGWCLIGDKPYSPKEIQDVHQLPIRGVLDFDPRGAAALTRSRWGRTRSALTRSARELAQSLYSSVHASQLTDIETSEAVA